MRTMKDQDVYSGIVLVMFSFIGIVSSNKLPHFATTGLSAGFYPTLLFIGLGLCGFALIYQGWRRSEKVPVSKFYWDKLLPIFVLFLAYAFLLKPLGFRIATAIFVFADMFLLGVRNVVTLIWVPIVSTFLVYYMFVKLFMIMLP